MKWLPYESWELASPLQVDQMVDGMARRVEPVKWFRMPWGNDHTPFQGSIHEHGFTISRVIHYSNSFLPVLNGTFIPTQSGTTIKIRMALHAFVLAFLAAWFGMLGLFGLAGILLLVSKGDWTLIGILAGMALFAVAMTWGCFWAEAGKTKRLFLELMLEIHEEAAGQSPRPNERRS